MSNSKSSLFKAEAKSLYLLMGRDLGELDEVPAGNVVGIGGKKARKLLKFPFYSLYSLPSGLSNFILKSATLSSNLACPAFIEVTQSAVPILRVAIEPARIGDLSKLVQGLHLLNQADANVQVREHSNFYNKQMRRESHIFTTG